MKTFSNFEKEKKEPVFTDSLDEKTIALRDLRDGVRNLAAARSAAKLAGQKSESLILVELYDQNRIHFERN